MVLGRQGKWTHAFREMHTVAQSATHEILRLYQHVLFGMFMLAGSCGQAAEAARFLSEHPAMLQLWPTLMAALEHRATGLPTSLFPLSAEERAIAEVFVRCMEQVVTAAQPPRSETHPW